MVTQEQFEAFVIVQESGETNMWDTRRVSSLSGGVLTRENVLAIIKNYMKLRSLYNG